MDNFSSISNDERVGYTDTPLTIIQPDGMALSIKKNL